MVGIVKVLVLVGGLFGWASGVGAATYFVDFVGGSDQSEGGSAQAAFKHCPGDPAAEGKAKTTALAPGDTVIFRGGVVYRGTIAAATSGQKGRPIVYNGNTAGTFGTGRAVIDGSEGLTGWKQCTSAEECGGNPNWKNIYWTAVAKGAGLFTINLCEGNVTLPIAQDPNPKDPFFEDVVSTYRPVVDPPPAAISGVRIIPGKGMAENPTRKYVLLVDGIPGTSAILDPLVGAELTFRPAQPATIESVGIAIADPKYYAPPKEVAFLADGKEVLRATLEANQGLQNLSLPASVAMKELTLKVLSAQGDKQGYSALGSLEAYDAGGKNVLLGPPLTVYRDANYFTQRDEHAWDGAYFALHGRPNVIYYQKVLSFDPRTSTITMEMLTADQYPTTGSPIGRFSMLNALCVLDRPGEYVVDEQPRADGKQRVYLWPLDATGEPRGISYSVRSVGFTVSGSHVTVEGFLIRKQGGKANAFGITGGRGSDTTIRDNEITLVRAARNQVIGFSDANRVTIAGNYVHECRRAGAIALDRCADSVIRDNRLHKNGATCLLLYRSRNIRVERNVLTDHKGMHANGLTAYVNCRDIAFVGNRVSGGNNALTLQEGEDMLVASNLFDAEGFASPVGLWGVGTLKNIRFYNNLFLRTDPNSSWGLGVYCGGKGDMVGYVFKNNVIDGIYREGPIVAVHENNVYTRPCVSGAKENDWKMGANEVLEPDLKKLFVDPDKGDWRPRPGGPLDGTGVDVGLTEDITGAKVPQGQAPNTGAYQTR